MAATVGSIRLNFKTLRGREFILTVPADLPVPELQQRIADSEGVPVSRQRLIYQGKVLKPDQTLRSYNIEDGDALHLIVRAEDAPPAPPAGSSAASAASSASLSSSPPFPPPPPAGFSFGPLTPFPGFPGGQMVMANLNVPTNGALPDLNQLVNSVLNNIGALTAQLPQPLAPQQATAVSPSPSSPPQQPAPAAAAPQLADVTFTSTASPPSAPSAGSGTSSAPFAASFSASAQPASDAPQFMFAPAAAGGGGGPFAAGPGGAPAGMLNGFPPALRPVYGPQGQPLFPQAAFPQQPFLAVSHQLTVNSAREALNAAAQAAPSQSASSASTAGRHTAYEENMSGLLSLLSQSHALLSDAPRPVARVIDLLQAQDSASSSVTPAQRSVFQREAHQLGLFLRRLGHALGGAGRLLSHVAPQNPNNSAPLALAPAPVVPLLGPVERPTTQQMGAAAAAAAGGGAQQQQQQWQQPQIHIQLQQGPMQSAGMSAAGAAPATASGSPAAPPAAGSVPAASVGNLVLPLHPMLGGFTQQQQPNGPHAALRQQQQQQQQLPPVGSVLTMTAAGPRWLMPGTPPTAAAEQPVSTTATAPAAAAAARAAAAASSSPHPAVPSSPTDPPAEPQSPTSPSPAQGQELEPLQQAISHAASHTVHALDAMGNALGALGSAVINMYQQQQQQRQQHQQQRQQRQQRQQQRQQRQHQRQQQRQQQQQQAVPSPLPPVAPVPSTAATAATPSAPAPTSVSVSVMAPPSAGSADTAPASIPAAVSPPGAPSSAAEAETDRSMADIVRELMADTAASTPASSSSSARPDSSSSSVSSSSSASSPSSSTSSLNVPSMMSLLQRVMTAPRSSSSSSPSPSLQELMRTMMSASSSSSPSSSSSSSSASSSLMRGEGDGEDATLLDMVVGIITERLSLPDLLAVMSGDLSGFNATEDDLQELLMQLMADSDDADVRAETAAFHAQALAQTFLTADVLSAHSSQLRPDADPVASVTPVLALHLRSFIDGVLARRASRQREPTAAQPPFSLWLRDWGSQLIGEVIDSLCRCYRDGVSSAGSILQSVISSRFAAVDGLGLMAPMVAAPLQSTLLSVWKAWKQRQMTAQSENGEGEAWLQQVPEAERALWQRVIAEDERSIARMLAEQREARRQQRGGDAAMRDEEEAGEEKRARESRELLHSPLSAAYLSGNGSQRLTAEMMQEGGGGERKERGREQQQQQQQQDDATRFSLPQRLQSTLRCALETADGQQAEEKEEAERKQAAGGSERREAVTQAVDAELTAAYRSQLLRDLKRKTDKDADLDAETEKRIRRNEEH